MPTARQVLIYNLHKTVCIGNGHPQTVLSRRVLEGAMTNTALGGRDFAEPAPRSSDNPGLVNISVWVTWIPRKLSAAGSTDVVGDNPSSRAWVFHAIGQCPAIDDNGNLVSLVDDMFGTNSEGDRFTIINPVLASDGAFWSFEILQYR